MQLRGMPRANIDLVDPRSSHVNPIMTASSTESLQLQPMLPQVSFEDDYCPDPRVFAPSTPTSSSVLQHQSTKAVLIPEELTSWWFSGIAEKLFRPLDGESAEEAINSMIDILGRATTSPKGCYSIVKGSNEQLKHLLHEEDLKKVHAKAVYLREALYIARDTINDDRHFSFRQCCNAAVCNVGDQLKPYNICCGQTVGCYLRDFRQGRAFSHYASKVLTELSPLMAFFDTEHDLNILFKLQLSSNLAAISSKSAHQLFFRNIIPVAALKRGYGETDGAQKIISEFSLDRLHHIHFYKWLKNQDFDDKYCPDSRSIVWTYTETVDL